MKVTIDPFAGFCFGVERAIRVAEENLFGEVKLKSLGDIVHNEEESRRLSEKGLSVLAHEDFMNLKHGRVLFRAHGEPPKSYKIACRNATRVIDATCPVVKKLQSRVEKIAQEMKKKGGAVLIYGKADHPEVIGIVGHAPENIQVVENAGQLRNMELPLIVRLFSQTTMASGEFLLFQDAVRQRLLELYPNQEVDFKSFNTICKQVSGRERTMQKFAGEHEALLFVGGKSSSNGRHLFQLACSVNVNAHYISGPADINRDWLSGVGDVGITGATSTPDWLMEKVKEAVENL